jgi:hypothetical protein
MYRVGFTLSDVIVALVLSAIGLSVAVGAVAVQNEYANRVRCASHLKQIGQAMLMYANENKGNYPRTRWDPKNADHPVWGTPYENNPKLGPVTAAQVFRVPDSKDVDVEPAPNDVTAAIFLLMRTEQITSDVFVCPSRNEKFWQFGGGSHDATDWTNWPDKDVLRHCLNYSLQNPYPTTDAVALGFKYGTILPAEFVLAADINPGSGALLKLNVNSKPLEMLAGNSPNHSYEGQNVLFGDGRVQFASNPFVGINRDNIYTFGPSGTPHPDKGGDGIAGSTTGPEDSILLPTAHDLGLLTEKDEQALSAKFLSPDEIDALQNKLSGKHQLGSSSLEITHSKMNLSIGPTMIPYDYTIDGLRVHLIVQAPKTPPHGMSFQITDSGFTARGDFEGDWQRSK